MTDDEIKKFREKAIYSARKCGFGEHAEDIAREVVAKFTSGKGRHQTVDQAVIDIARRIGGDSRSLGSKQKRNLNLFFEPLDGIENSLFHGVTQSHQFDYPRIIDRLKSIDRAIVVLMYEWGFKQREIAYCFGVTEARICHMLRKLQIKLRYELKAEQ